MSKKIILTGGGTAGHVTPNLALLPRLRAEGYEIHYIGTAEGIEKSLVDGLEGVTYHTISAGKLRRYERDLADLKRETEQLERRKFQVESGR